MEGIDSGILPWEVRDLRGSVGSILSGSKLGRVYDREMDAF